MLNLYDRFFKKPQTTSYTYYYPKSNNFIKSNFKINPLIKDHKIKFDNFKITRLEEEEKDKPKIEKDKPKIEKDKYKSDKDDNNPAPIIILLMIIGYFLYKKKF